MTNSHRQDDASKPHLLVESTSLIVIDAVVKFKFRNKTVATDEVHHFRAACLLSLKDLGLAVREHDCSGNLVFRATPQFRSDNSPPGHLVRPGSFAQKLVGARRPQLRKNVSECKARQSTFLKQTPLRDSRRAAVMLYSYEPSELNDEELRRFVGALHAASAGNPASLSILNAAFSEWPRFRNRRARTELRKIWNSFELEQPMQDAVAILKAFCASQFVPIPPPRIRAIFEKPNFDRDYNDWRLSRYRGREANHIHSKR